MIPERSLGAEEERRPEQVRALRLWVVLSRAHEALTARLQEEVARHDLTLMEFGILEVLYHKGPLLLGEVQRRILVSSGGVTYLVDRLEKKGLVERLPCSQDRRARYAALTAAGGELIGRIFPAHADCIEALMSPLSQEEQVTAHEFMKRLGLAAASGSAGYGERSQVDVDRKGG
jgi:MarR family transcriptional regulator, 2-MHQ and catechol-resistance regulon repressor